MHEIEWKHVICLYNEDYLDFTLYKDYLIFHFGSPADYL